MTCRIFADRVHTGAPRAAISCLAAVLLCALQAAAVAQENQEAESGARAQSAEEAIEQPSDAAGNVALPIPDDVPTKGESDAARRVREGKALIVGPSKSRISEPPQQDAIRQQMFQIQMLQQQLASKQKQLETKHQRAIEKLAQALRDGKADDQAANQAVVEWQKQQQQIEVERKELQSAAQRLERSAAQVAAEAARLQQQQQERAALPADATTRVYSLRHSQAPAMARVLSEILGGKDLRMAVDERTNSLIVVAQKDTEDIVEALLMKLDQSAGGTTKQDQPGETLQLRIVWLLDGLTGEGKEPHEISMNPEVVDALHELGFEDPRVVCQQVTTLTLNEDGRRGAFDFTVPVLINSQSWQLEGHGQIESMADERFNLKFDLGFQRVITNVGGGRADAGQRAQLGGSIYTPLGHYTVMGTTTFVATNYGSPPEGHEVAIPPRPTQQQHLSAFVVYLDRAREFPAKSTEEKQ